jgi:antitoxin PrlF
MEVFFMGAPMIDNAKIMSKGQVTIPIDIRKKLNIGEGDRLTFICEGDYAIVMNSAVYAMKTLQAGMFGKFENAGLGTDEEINDYIKEIRSEIESL